MMRSRSLADKLDALCTLLYLNTITKVLQRFSDSALVENLEGAPVESANPDPAQ
ncbi:MAG: hypothetical protein R3C11_28730 [Planctomycetaceae bacterium]